MAHLAAEHHISRKFVSHQAGTARQALRDAFDPDPDDGHAPFHLPVTKAWLRQLTLGLVLIGHSPWRGVTELLRDLFDYPLSLGAVPDIVRGAVPLARRHNDRRDLSRARVGAHDEIFQARRPVPVGCDADSTYGYLLSQEACRDADTWAVRLLELADRGRHPEAAVAGGGSAPRAGPELALPGVPCRGDVFHALRNEVGPPVRYLENRAYRAIAARSKVEARPAGPGRRRDRRELSLAQRLRRALEEEAQAVPLAEDVALLARWLREGVLAVAGPGHAERCELYDFVVAQLRAREALCPHRIKPACDALERQRGDLLAFAERLDRDREALAQECQVLAALAREALRVPALSPYDARRGPREAALWRAWGGRYHRAREAVEELSGRWCAPAAW